MVQNKDVIGDADDFFCIGESDVLTSRYLNGCKYSSFSSVPFIFIQLSDSHIVN